MKRNVLFICKGHQNIAGAQLYLQQVVEVFPADQYELHYAFQAKDGTRIFDEIENIRCIHRWEYDWRHLPFIASYKKAYRLFKKLHPDFILFNSNEDEIIPPLFAAWACRIKHKIMIVHWALDECSLPLWVKKGQIPFPILSRYSSKLRAKRFFVYSLLDKLVFVNRSTRQAFIKLYKVHSHKCKTIYNGIDVARFHLPPKAREIMRAELGVADNETMILATGNLSPVKGHEVLIKAIADVAEQGKLVKCFIAGQGELQGMLEDLVKQEKVTAQCKLLGYRDDIPQLLAATDIFCMPSLNEALGYSILEAMAAGKPVIASNVGGIPEIITNEKEGFLVTPGNVKALSDAVDSLYANQKLRVKTGEAGAVKVNEVFSAQNMMKQTAEFLGI